VMDGVTHTNWAEKWEIILMNTYERPLHK
jgi:hypothetical protein